MEWFVYSKSTAVGYRIIYPTVYAPFTEISRLSDRKHREHRNMRRIGLWASGTWAMILGQKRTNAVSSALPSNCEYSTLPFATH